MPHPQLRHARLRRSGERRSEQGHAEGAEQDARDAELPDHPGAHWEAFTIDFLHHQECRGKKHLEKYLGADAAKGLDLPARRRSRWPSRKKKLPVAGCRAKGKAGKARAGGWAAFTDGGTAPRWVIAARVVMVLALAATIPTILGVEHGNRLCGRSCIAALPFFWMTFGYHLWRRICPLAVLGQLGRLLGARARARWATGWASNYLLVQLGLMVVALSLRLTVTNGSAVGLAVFLGAVVVAAIVVSFVYGGKTWCNFLCPVGLVEKIYTEPARSASGAADELTSQCAPCVACKKHCPDIDLEQGYWKEATRAARAASRTSRGPASSSRSTSTTSSRAAPGRTTSTARGRYERDAAVRRAGLLLRARDSARRRGAADADRVRRSRASSCSR